MAEKKGWLIFIPAKTGLTKTAREFLEEKGHTFITGESEDLEYIRKTLVEKQPDVLWVSEAKIKKDLFAAGLPNLKMLARRGTGYEGIDCHAAREMGIECVYAPIGNSSSVSEVAIYHILHASLDIEHVRDLLYTKDFYSAKRAGTYHNVATKTLGVFGCGNIGSRVAERASALKMNIIAYDPYKKAADFPKCVTVVRDLKEFLGAADFVTIHSLVTEETKGFFNMEKFRMMKPTAYLINSARGALVVEKDAIEAVKTGVIRGCEFDTCDQEPLTPDREVLHTPGIYVTPHMGGSTVEANERVAMMDAIGIQEIFEGKKPSWPIPETDYSKLPRYTDTKEAEVKAPELLDIEAL